MADPSQEPEESTSKRAIKRLLVIPWFSHPQQRQRWGDKQLHPHTNWGDIFFDLFYVAGAYNLGNLLRDEPTARGLLYFVGCFLPLIALWTLKLFYDARYFVGDDVYHTLYEVISLLALATSVLNIRTVAILSDPTKKDMLVYIVGIVISYVLAIGRYVEVMICQRLGRNGLYPEAGHASLRESLWMGFACICYLAAAIVAGVSLGEYPSNPVYNDNHTTYNNETYQNETYSDDHHRFLAPDESSIRVDDRPIYVVLGAALASQAAMSLMVLVYMSMVEDHKAISIPMNIDYCIHRFGEWTMLMLGETVLSLLIVDLIESPGYFRTFFCGLLSIIALEWLHFRSQPHHADAHAMRRHKNAGVLFNLLNQVYSIALVILGATYKMFLFEYVYSNQAAAATNADTYVGNGAHRRSMLERLLPSLSRLLAGGESAALRFDTEDRQRRIAIFFSGSLAVVWFCMDAMVLTHRGLKANVERLECKDLKNRIFCKLLTLIRLMLIAMAATLFLYEQRPDALSVIGLAGIVVQLILRMVGLIVFPSLSEQDEESADEHERILVSTLMSGKVPDPAAESSETSSNQ